MVAFEYRVVRYFHEKIKQFLWCIKCMLFTRHSEFCHQSFDTFVAHMSVFAGGRANVRQTFFFLPLVNENTWKLTLEAPFLQNLSIIFEYYK